MQVVPMPWGSAFWGDGKSWIANGVLYVALGVLSLEQRTAVAAENGWNQRFRNLESLLTQLVAPKSHVS